MNPISFIQQTNTRKVLSAAPAFLQQEEGAQDLGDPPLRGLPAITNKIAHAVLERHPTLSCMLRRHGKKSVASYICEYTGFVCDANNRLRQSECIEAIGCEAEKVYGPRLAASTCMQLKHYFFASTTDHHGPLHNPWVLNYNLLAGNEALAHPDSALCNVITLACSNVSLNNFSFPRGISFSADGAHARGQRKMSFFSNKFVGSRGVITQPAYDRASIERMMEGLHELRSSCSISRESFFSLQRVLRTLYAHPDVLSCSTYAHQIGRINFLLWERFNFRSNKKNVRFIYLEQEAVVRRLIVSHHLKKDTLLHRVLFDTSENPLVKKYFEGMKTCFNENDCDGTYLFWALCPQSGTRLQLWKKGGHLVSNDGSISIALTSEAIGLALRRGTLIPSVLTTFMVLCFYYGLTCFGGLGQVAYLPVMKKAYEEMVLSLGDTESLHACQHIETDRLGGEIIIAFLAQRSGRVVPATAIDLLLYGNGSTNSDIANIARTVSFSDAMMVTMPTEYPMRYSPSERDPALSAVTMEDIASEMAQAHRIEPVLSTVQSSSF